MPDGLSIVGFGGFLYLVYVGKGTRQNTVQRISSHISWHVVVVVHGSSWLAAQFFARGVLRVCKCPQVTGLG